MQIMQEQFSASCLGLLRIYGAALQVIDLLDTAYAGMTLSGVLQEVLGVEIC